VGERLRLQIARVHMCIHIYIYVCIYVHIYTRTDMCIDVYIYINCQKNRTSSKKSHYNTAATERTFDINIGLHASTPISFAADFCATRNCWRQTCEHFLVLVRLAVSNARHFLHTVMLQVDAISRMYDSKLHYAALCCMMLQVEEQFRMLDVTMLLVEHGDLESLKDSSMPQHMASATNSFK